MWNDHLLCHIQECKTYQGTNNTTKYRIELRITIKGLSENKADASVFVSITLNSVSWFSAKLGTHIPKWGSLTQNAVKTP